MRELRGIELMAIRKALQREKLSVSRSIKRLRDPVALRAYRIRLERLSALQEEFRPGCRVTVAA